MGLLKDRTNMGRYWDKKKKRVVKTTPLCYDKMAELVSCFCSLVGVLN